METIKVSDSTLAHLRAAAALRGVDTDAYAEELLGIGLGVAHENGDTPTGNLHHAMEFSAAAMTGRTAKEIDTEIECARDEWDEPGRRE